MKDLVKPRYSVIEMLGAFIVFRAISDYGVKVGLVALVIVVAFVAFARAKWGDS